MTNAAIIKLTAQEKDMDKNPRQLRSAGFIPATVYGKGMESRNIQVNAHEFELASRNALDAVYELQLGKEKIKVTIIDVQKKHSINQVLNIEFKTV